MAYKASCSPILTGIVFRPVSNSFLLYPSLNKSQIKIKVINDFLTYSHIVHAVFPIVHISYIFSNKGLLWSMPLLTFCSQTSNSNSLKEWKKYIFVDTFKCLGCFQVCILVFLINASPENCTPLGRGRLSEEMQHFIPIRDSIYMIYVIDNQVKMQVVVGTEVKWHLQHEEEGNRQNTLLHYKNTLKRK